MSELNYGISVSHPRHQQQTGDEGATPRRCHALAMKKEHRFKVKDSGLKVYLGECIEMSWMVTWREQEEVELLYYE